MDKDVVVSRSTHLEQAAKVSRLQAENARLREAALAALECIEKNVPPDVFAPRQWLREVLGLPIGLDADLEGRN